MEQDQNLEQVIESQKQAKRLAVVGVALSMVALAFVVAAIGFMVAGLKTTVSDLAVELNRSEADAILANANVSDQTNAAVTVIYYEQKADECVDLYDVNLKSLVDARQFEWSKCGYYNSEIETELVEGRLNERYLPVATGTGKLTPNRGMTTSGFLRWFAPVEGASKRATGTMNLVYNAEEASFKYEEKKFEPVGAGKLFTMNMGVPFEALLTGEESFEITADDDTWVFVGDKLVIDMGGVHEATTGRFEVRENGEVYAGVEELAYTGVTLTAKEGAVVRIFHANRDSASSEFAVKFKGMVLNVTDATLAKGDGVTVAYDPTNPGYVAPLGESLTVRGNRSKSLAVALTAQLLLFGALAASFTFIIMRVLKRMQ